MKRWVYIWVFILIFSQANYGQTLQSLSILSSHFVLDEKEEKSTSKTSAVDLFLFNDDKIQGSDILEYRESLVSFTEKMKAKNEKFNDEEYLLKKLFYKVHNKFLKNYNNYVAFTDIFDSGQYDCVTGTALYAIILDEMGFNYEIHEFDFHVLLIVDLEGEKIMFESTDFYSGFVVDDDEIEDRLAFYRETKNDKNSDHYIYKANNNKKIKLEELAGLLYFNLAVEQYNLQNFDFALQYLDKAEGLYDSERMGELRSIIQKITRKESYFSLNK